MDGVGTKMLCTFPIGGNDVWDHWVGPIGGTDVWDIGLNCFVRPLG